MFVFLFLFKCLTPFLLHTDTLEKTLLTTSQLKVKSLFFSALIAFGPAQYIVLRLQRYTLFITYTTPVTS